MPDLSMCTNHGCRIAEHCYRYRAVPGRMQSWHSFDGRECYMPIYAGRQVRAMSECAK